MKLLRIGPRRKGWRAHCAAPGTRLIFCKIPPASKFDGSLENLLKMLYQRTSVQATTTDLVQILSFSQFKERYWNSLEMRLWHLEYIRAFLLIFGDELHQLCFRILTNLVAKFGVKLQPYLHTWFFLWSWPVKLTLLVFHTLSSRSHTILFACRKKKICSTSKQKTWCCTLKNKNIKKYRLVSILCCKCILLPILRFHSISKASTLVYWTPVYNSFKWAEFT